MERVRFAAVSRALSTILARRTLAGAFSLSALGVPAFTEAKKKKRKKKVKRNDFGCVDVGKFCKNNSQCCSTICAGKKGKKKCKAHNVSTCQPGEDSCQGTDVDCTTDTGDDGFCTLTTGNASYCRAAGNCTVCTKDADCVAVCGTGAACIVCADCPESGDTACVGQNSDSCGF